MTTGHDTAPAPDGTVDTIRERGRRLVKAIHPRQQSSRIDFATVNAAARRELPSLLSRWLPDGRTEGHEFVARNPRRVDRNVGSFKVNVRTGKWSDFATGDKGGDPVSLAAYLFGTSQAEAARRLAEMLGVR